MSDTSPPTDDLMAALRQVLRTAPGRPFASYSPLYRVLRQGFFTVSDAITRLNVGWTELAREANEAGLTNENGSAISPDIVRKIWARIVRDEAKSPSLRQVGARDFPPLSTPVAQQPLRLVSPPAADRPKPAFDFSIPPLKTQE